MCKDFSLPILHLTISGWTWTASSIPDGSLCVCVSAFFRKDKFSATLKTKKWNYDLYNLMIPIIIGSQGHTGIVAYYGLQTLTDFSLTGQNKQVDKVI